MKSLYEIITSDDFSDWITDLKFDFEGKTIKHKKKYIFNNGTVIGQELHLADGNSVMLAQDMPLLPDGMSWENIQGLYDDYINSKPNQNNDRERGYFRPKSSDELPFEVLVSGMSRTKAKYKLEGFILLGIVSGILKWENEDHWFWRGNNGLIMYRSWFE